MAVLDTIKAYVNLVNKKYSEMYDGLIFVKNLSISNSNLSVK